MIINYFKKAACVLIFSTSSIAQAQIETEPATLADMIAKFDTKPPSTTHHYIVDSDGNLVKRISLSEDVNKNHFRFDTRKGINKFYHLETETVNINSNTTTSRTKKITNYNVVLSSIKFIPSLNAFSFKAYRVGEENYEYNPSKKYYKDIDDDETQYQFIIAMGKYHFNKVQKGFALDDGNREYIRYYD